MELELWCTNDPKINKRYAWNQSYGVQKMCQSELLTTLKMQEQNGEIQQLYIKAFKEVF